MNAPSCIHPLFAEMIERHFPDLKISPGNGNGIANTEPNRISTSLAVAKCGEASEGPERDGHKPLMRNRTATDAIPDRHTASDNFHLAFVLLAVLEENAILKQRLENLAKVEAEMFPK